MQKAIRQFLLYCAYCVRNRYYTLRLTHQITNHINVYQWKIIIITSWSLTTIFNQSAQIRRKKFEKENVIFLHLSNNLIFFNVITPEIHTAKALCLLKKFITQYNTHKYGHTRISGVGISANQMIKMCFLKLNLYKEKNAWIKYDVMIYDFNIYHSSAHFIGASGWFLSSFLFKWSSDYAKCWSLGAENELNNCSKCLIAWSR